MKMNKMIKKIVILATLVIFAGCSSAKNSSNLKNHISLETDGVDSTESISNTNKKIADKNIKALVKNNTKEDAKKSSVNTLIAKNKTKAKSKTKKSTSNKKFDLRKRGKYKIKGKKYEIFASGKNFQEIGIASWYGPGFHGKLTANGEKYNMYAMTAAHKTLPLGTRVVVTNLRTKKKITVRINDRGPFHKGRVIDLSKKAAQKLGIIKKGYGRVHVKAISKK